MSTNDKANVYETHRDTSNGRAYWSVFQKIGILWVMLATGKDTAGNYSVIEQLCPRGPGAPPHLHEWADEAFYVLEGEATFFVSGQTIKASVGSFVAVPRQTIHSFQVDTDSARFLNFYTPAGFENIIIESSVAAQQLTLPPASVPEADPQRAMELMKKYGMTLVGIPPQNQQS